MDGAQMRMAQDYPVVASSPMLGQKYLGVLHGQLMEIGYCILEGVLNDEAVPNCINTELHVPGMTSEAVGFEPDAAMSSENAPYSVKLFDVARDARFNRQMDAMIKHLEDMFPTVEERKAGSRTTEWYSINNEWDDDLARESAKAGRTRYMTDRSFLMEQMEQDRDMVEYTKIRAMLDARIAMGLHLVLAGTPGARMEEVWIPRSGGRFLATVPGAVRQKAHTDAHTRDEEEVRTDAGTPGFFAMATGSSEAEVFIVKHGHRVHNMVWASGEESTNALQRTLRAEKVIIPPFSVIFVRGDTVHFGAGWDDHSGSVPKGVLIRYHMYFVPGNSRLGDSIYETKFKTEVWDDIWEAMERDGDAEDTGGGGGEDENTEEDRRSNVRVREPAQQ